MTDYFESIERQKELKKVLDEWVGTPFRHYCGVKGLGCDCIHFVARVLEELKIIKNVKIPDYPRDWHLHNTRELLREGILKELNVKDVDFQNPKNGDIICSHYGKAASHAAFYFDGYLYQAYNRVGVCKFNFDDAKAKTRMKFAYRVIE
jgi:cell wall-associated NlpC family hydrolase